MPEMLKAAMSSFVGVRMMRLLLAAILGGAIGLEREIKHRPAGLRTNIFICMGAALFTLLSDDLAVEHIGDHTRIAAQIIPGIGFIGAGSILHNRGNLVTGITSAATLFIVASLGMAVGGGLYTVASLATALVLLCLYLLGKVEDVFSLKLAVHSYEVTGASAEEVSTEVNRILECVHSMMENVQIAVTTQHVRLQFDLEGTHREQSLVLHNLAKSTVLGKVTPLGRVQAE
jgi:putative Mg2+ transporter-C (MgtC) family protein